MLIYLIGLPGVGKTTLGKTLSEKLNYHFLDLDADIEKSVGLTIPEIFNHRGEEYFRETEKLVLEKSFQLQNTVIATGGGTPCFHNNMKTINENGNSIYLKANPKDIAERFKERELEDRPLFNNVNPASKLEELLEQRSSYYELSKLTVDINEKKSLETIISSLNP